MRNFIYGSGVVLAVVGIVILAASTGQSQRFRGGAMAFRGGGGAMAFRGSVFHYNPQPHWGCYGYCDGPLRPHQPHWGCFGYCPGPLPYPHHYTCFGYCPYIPPYYP